MQEKLQEFKISKETQAKLKSKERLKKELAEGKNGQQIIGFSQEVMSQFYGVTYHLFENSRYAEAADAFLFLVTLNPQRHDYWLGLGMSTQRLGNFEAAIDAYEMAAICELENPVPYFYLAKCLFAMHDRENALHALELAIEYSGETLAYTELKQKALAAKLLIIETEL